MTNLDFSIKRIISSQSSEYLDMESLLRETFPACEYRDLDKLHNLVDSDRDCNFYSNLVYIIEMVN